MTPNIIKKTLSLSITEIEEIEETECLDYIKSNVIKNFILLYCNEDEKKEYFDYIKGDKNKDSWIEKALIQREKIIIAQPICTRCSMSINIYENGYCYCINKHNCYDEITNIINSLQ